jgi:parallel beta-helix repeat protein
MIYMYRRIAAILVCITLLFNFIIMIDIAPQVKAATTIYVDDVPGFGPGNPDEDFTSIQAAINFAISGDTVYVYNGTYYENVKVNRTITVTGEDVNSTIIDGGNNDYSMKITSDWVTVSGFSLINGGPFIGSHTFFITSDHNTIFNNYVSSSADNGIYLETSHWNNIFENNVSSNGWHGIYLYHSDQNNISNNIVFSNSLWGIYLVGSDFCNITDNNLYSNNEIGIYLSSCKGIRVSDNIMELDGIHIYGEQIEYWNTHTIDDLNLVNGKPVYYMKNQTGLSTPLGVGQVILANCTNISVHDQNLTDSNSGIQLGFSSNNSIKGNNISNQNYAIYIYKSNDNIMSDNVLSSNIHYGSYIKYSKGNNVTRNYVSDSERGIYFSDSDENLVTSNMILSNTMVGIGLVGSGMNNVTHNNLSKNDVGIGIDNAANQNTIRNNTISSNDYGITLDDSVNNRVYHNDILVNTNQAVDGSVGGNYWDNGYPQGGNFWSDYYGYDLNSTPTQDVPPPDGIGDTPYIVDVGSQDNYPFMNPFGNWTPPPDISPPIISSVEVIGITETSATIVWQTHEHSDSRVNWSENPDLSSNSTKFSSTYVTSHSITITNLLADQTYYFEVTSADPSSNIATDNNGSVFYIFTTLPPDMDPPDIFSVSVSDITMNSAVITWVTDELSDSRVNWSENPDLSDNSSYYDSMLVKGHSIILSSLSPNQIYYFEVISADQNNNMATDNNGTFYYRFKTMPPDTIPPIISSVSVIDVTETSAKIIWITDEPSTSGVNWSEHSDLSNSISNYESTNTLSHTIILTSLEPSKTYYFLVTSSDVYGNSETDTNGSLFYRFTTLSPDIIPPAISDITFTPSPQEVYYSLELSAKISDDHPINNVSIVIMDPQGTLIGNFSMEYDSISERYHYNSIFSKLGTYSFIIWANDISDNWNSTQSITSQFIIHDTIPPVITLKTSQFIQELNRNMNITASVIDNFETNTVIIQIIGPDGNEIINVTMIKEGTSNNYWYERAFSTLGNYKFIIWTKDTSENWAYFEGNILIQDTTAPFVDAGSSQEVKQGDTVPFDGSGSNDIGGIENLTWNFEYNGETVTLYGINPSFKFEIIENYTVALLVKDTSGNSASDTIWINVKGVDSDSDGLTDYDEENIYRTIPSNPDTDNDGINDGDEILQGTDPLVPKKVETPQKPFLEEFWWIFLLVVVIVVLSMLFLILKSRRKEESQEEEDVETEAIKDMEHEAEPTTSIKPQSKIRKTPPPPPDLGEPQQPPLPPPPIPPPPPK